MLIALIACDGPDPVAEVPFEDRVVDVAAMTRAFATAKDGAGWATDLHAVFAAHAIPATNGNTCEVAAIVGQESGFSPNPAVPGIGKLIDVWVDEKQAEMGKMQGWAFGTGLRAVLDGKAKGAKQTWSERLHSAKTEKDVDDTYRAFVADFRGHLPGPLRAAETAAAFAGLDLDGWNPITTAGCMQVKVDQAEAHARADGIDRATVRDSLYTRQGCLHYGVIRLFEVDYDDPSYRFADYNAGVWSSRNAAFQHQVSTLTGTTLARDGDLLRYEDGAPSSTPSSTLTAVLSLAPGLELGEWRVKHDLAREKDESFADTHTYEVIGAAYAAKAGKAAPDAEVPEVELESLKFSTKRTTAWFAASVRKRYDACLGAMGK